MIRKGISYLFIDNTPNNITGWDRDMTKDESSMISYR